MHDQRRVFSSVGKAHEIDQRAIKLFLTWLPDCWLPRKQDPDFFVDYLVEIVEQGEPTGKHFGVQIKGFKSTPKVSTPLSYPFKVKHLRYYLDRSQHPIYLILINTTSGEGFWKFAQGFLKGILSKLVSEKQKTLTVPFEPENTFLNLTKFKFSLQEAEQFVRDIHPGSIQAALQKRKAQLESVDPRCSISISVEDGKEHITIFPKEVIQFTTKIKDQNYGDWQKFVERGEPIKLKRENIHFLGVPLMQEALKDTEGEIEIKYGKEVEGSIHIISKTEPGKIIPIEGLIRSGTKGFSFRGQLPHSPLSIAFDILWNSALKAEPFCLSMSFQPKNWTGQYLLSLAYFDQIKAFANAFSGKPNPEMEIFIQGNSFQKGEMDDDNGHISYNINQVLDWFSKCRWLANHFELNPLYPSLEILTRKQISSLEQLYGFLTKQGIAVPSPNIQFEFFTDKLASKRNIANSDNILRIEKPEQTFDLLGFSVRLAPMSHVFTEMQFVSQTPQADGTVKVILRGTKNTTRTTNVVHLSQC